LDIATFIGLGLALVAIMTGMGGDVGLFLDMTSIILVLGGTIGSLFIAYPIERVMNIFKIMLSTFFYKPYNMSDTIRTLVTSSEKARREGLLSLEQDVEKIEDPFMKKGLQLVVDGIDPELLKSMLETDLELREDEGMMQRNMLAYAATISPSFGMVGTLIGLVRMLGHLNDPSTVGPSFAIALTTTFFGAFFAYVFFMPMSEKLARRLQMEMRYRRMILEGVLSIQSGDNPRILEEKLKGFLTDKELQNYESGNVPQVAEGGATGGS